MSTASELKKGSYFIHNNEPVRVNRKEVVVYGTHSHSKLKLFIQGLNDKGERSINMHHTDRVDIVEIIKKVGQVISKSDERVQIMDNVSYDMRICTIIPVVNEKAKPPTGVSEKFSANFVRNADTPIIEEPTPAMIKYFN